MCNAGLITLIVEIDKVVTVKNSRNLGNPSKLCES